jgi:hypothetical protein
MAAKRRAAELGITLTELVERGLRQQLRTAAPRRGYRLRWRTESGRLQPGVTLEDRDALFDLMDGR